MTYLSCRLLSITVNSQFQTLFSSSLSWYFISKSGWPAYLVCVWNWWDLCFPNFWRRVTPIFDHGWWKCNVGAGCFMDAWFTRGLRLLRITWFVTSGEARFTSVPTFTLEEPSDGSVEVTACLVTRYSMILVCVYLNSKTEKMNLILCEAEGFTP